MGSIRQARYEPTVERADGTEEPSVPRLMPDFMARRARLRCTRRGLAWLPVLGVRIEVARARVLRKIAGDIATRHICR